MQTFTKKLQNTQFAATYTSCLFAGAALYISIAQSPASLELETEAAVKFFPHWYKRAAKMQAGLALSSSVFGILTGINKKKQGKKCTAIIWFVGSALIFSVVPVTYSFIMNINKQLLQEGGVKTEEENKNLLKKWGQRHLIRTVLSILSSTIFLAAIQLE
ncbi:hypothetical protein PPERSA_08508 [Pseudocohnilembus persalinus]|uniref:DUF1772 domain-containing protein n=1 Tax=Pseudocohnilembus persalinus TaxID=266149 RepID=A0A0V0R6J3_PSEPJ|nr:hypothetical protein PPERSA_08508 [Pseudocohnilembus persalinus]|eukprot:KRX10105.1 hypothetical protein PPERSA_08508 [Pseudocohnilembus persalinus]